MKAPGADMSERKTIFSPSRLYRYTLWREWDLSKRTYCQFIGLNPSTADETRDDSTVRRCIDFAKRWGYGALCMTNLFAFRSRDPDLMKEQTEPIGPDNDGWLHAIAARATLVVAAWGKSGAFMDRAGLIVEMVPNLHCLGLNRDGSPAHPLYIPKTTRPMPLRHTVLRAVGEA